MTAYIPTELRQLVHERADGRCEYCRYPQEVSFLAFEVEHIIAEKHGGAASADNLALACPYCNRYKGTDLGSLDPETGRLTPFFNPRTQEWLEHFQLDGARGTGSVEWDYDVAVLSIARNLLRGMESAATTLLSSPNQIVTAASHPTEPVPGADCTAHP